MKPQPIFIAINLLLCITAMPAQSQSCKNTTIEARIKSEQFLHHGDGTVTDVKTGLSWSVCSLGQVWSENGCQGAARSYAWHEALTAVESLNAGGGLAGTAEWRIPNIKELGSIVDHHCHSPAVNLEIFPDTPSSAYWSSTALANNPSEGHGIDFKTGSDLIPEVTTLRHVRLVSGG